jgi:Core-2/I-Branching enzyme
VNTEPDPGERRGTLAVVVLSHRAPAQVARLVSRLDSGRDTVTVVHHDPRSEPLRLRTSSTVALVPNPVPCPWGKPGRIEALRRSLRWLKDNVPTLSWALVISGQDYPIRTMASIEDELAVARCDAFIRHFRLDSDPAQDVHRWQTKMRSRHLYRRRLPGSAKSVELPWPRRNPFHDGFGLYAGDLWINLSVRAVDKMLDSRLYDPLMRYLQRAPVPDEAALVTMAVSGEPELNVVNELRRYIRWPGGGVLHPATLGPADVPEMRASNGFFARKLNPEAWPEAYDALDELAEGREKQLHQSG